MPISYKPEYTGKDRRKHPRIAARDVMSKKLIKVMPEMKIQDAVNVFLKNKVSGAPVVDEDGIHVGMLSEKDCLKLMMNELYHESPGTLVKDYMSHIIHSVEADMDIFSVAQIFIETPYRRLPVYDKGKLVGQISRRDCLKAMQLIQKHKKKVVKK
ncbi:MAG: CBS domain-containing protein [Spirochaetia bacterium]|nr:CBS domain-containing protein [Spirochaetia bacterium]